MKKIDFAKCALFCLLDILLISSDISAQTGLNYLEHRNFTTDELGGGTERLTTVRSPFSNQLISQFRFRIYSPQTVDLSLGSNPELFSMMPTQEGADDFYTIFKLLNGDDLSEEFQFAVSSTHNQSEVLGCQFAPNYFAFENRLDTSATFYAGPNQIIHNSSTVNYLTCLLGFDMDGTLQSQRLISHGPGLTRSITSDKNKSYGLMNEDVQCVDFSFQDSIDVTENGVTTPMYSTVWATYLDVRYSNSEGYAGILEYSGKLEKRDAIVIGTNVYRVYEVSGSADLDPTESVTNYSTPADESHLVIACYNNLGNVEWMKTLAKNQCEVVAAGKFVCTLLNDDDKLVLEYFYSRSSTSNAYPSTFSALNNTEILESGELIVSGINWSVKKSPEYVYILNSENGDAIQIYSTKAVSSTWSGFTQFSVGDKHVSNLEPGKIIIHLMSSVSNPVEFLVKSLYPEQITYDTALQPSTSLYSELYVFSTTGSLLEDHFLLEYEQAADYAYLNYDAFAPLKDGRFLITGRIYKSVEMIFDNVPPVAVAASPDPYWDGDAIAIYAEKVPLRVRRQSEKNFKLYPNPASTFITIESKLVQAKYKIFNQVGKIIQSGSLQATSDRIDITTLASGLYLIQIESEPGIIEAQKFVKQ